MTPLRLPALLASSLLLCLAALACGGDGGGEGAAPPTPTATAEAAGGGAAEQALARYVETTLGKQFKEDCSKADAAQDTGKICSLLRGERENQRAYVLGLAFSEPTQWAILQQSGGQWNVVHSPAITPDTAGVPGIPWPLRTGVDVVVAGAAPCVNVREGPSLNQKAVDCIADGTRIRLAAGPTVADNYQWWQVEGRSGWVVSDFLRFPDAAQ